MYNTQAPPTQLVRFSTSQKAREFNGVYGSKRIENPKLFAIFAFRSIVYLSFRHVSCAPPPCSLKINAFFLFTLSLSI